MRKGFFRYLPDEPFRFKKIFNYPLQGLLIIAPVAVPDASIYRVLSTVEICRPIFLEPVFTDLGVPLKYAQYESPQKLNVACLTSGSVLRYSL